MKKVIMLALFASATWAVDFSQMSTEELMGMRGTISVSERPAFRAEMQKRMQTMTPAQRQQFMQSRGKGQGMGKGRGMGKGMQDRPTFATFDLNNDGKITQTEFYDAQAKHMTQKANEGKMMKNAGNAPTFESIDTDKDGIVTPTEFNTHQISQMQKMRQGGKGMGKGMMN